MSTYLFVVVFVCFFSMVGQVIFLYKRNTVRDLRALPLDIIINAALAGWGLWVIGGMQ